MRQDLDARSVGGRITDAVVSEATDMALEGADVARAHKGAVAGTLVALVAWIFRNPIIALIGKLLGRDGDDGKDRDND